MAWAERLFACVTCGKGVIKRAAATAEVRCIDCGIERSIAEMVQMRQRRGAFYDKWAAGMARAAAQAQARVQVTHEEDRRG